MPEPAEGARSVAGQNCPSCGAVLSPGTAKCPACGHDIGPAEDVDEVNEDEELEGKKTAVQVKKCPRCGDLIEDTMSNCRKCGLLLKPPQVPGARPPPPAVRPMAPTLPGGPQGPRPGQPGAPQQGPAPGMRPPMPAPQPAPAARPVPVPQAPPKPLTPEEKRAMREKYMVKGSQILLGLGIADAVVFGAGLWALAPPIGLSVNLSMCLATLIGIGIVVMKSGSHASAARTEMSEVEGKKVGWTLLGAFIILIVPIKESFGGVAPIIAWGYYSASWSAYGWVGILNPLILLGGSMMVALGVQGSRERIGYYTVWKNGVTVLVIAPLFSLLHALVPILVAVDWFNQTVGLVGASLMIIAFWMQRQRNKQFSELEAAMRSGDDMANRGQLDQAKAQYDVAIGMAHTLYSHLIYNPDAPYAQVRVPPAYSEPWFRKGRVLARMRNYRKAVAIFDMIIEMDPTNQVALLNRAEILAEMRDFEGSLRSVDRVLQIVPGHPDALRLRATIAETARKDAEEREKAIEAESVFGDDAGGQESGGDEFEEA